MATSAKKKMIREATSSVQGRQAERARAPVARAPSAPAAAGPSRVGARQPQAGPKLNELRGKIARMEKERARVSDAALTEIAEIETILGHLTHTAFSVVATAAKAEEIRARCAALRKVLS